VSLLTSVTEEGSLDSSAGNGDVEDALLDSSSCAEGRNSTSQVGVEEIIEGKECLRENVLKKDFS